MAGKFGGLSLKGCELYLAELKCGNLPSENDVILNARPHNHGVLGSLSAHHRQPCMYPGRYQLLTVSGRSETEVL